MTQYMISAHAGAMFVDGRPLDLPGLLVAADVKREEPGFLVGLDAGPQVVPSAQTFVDVTFRLRLGGYDVVEFSRGEVHATGDGPGVDPVPLGIVLCGACGNPFVDRGAYDAHTDGVTCRRPEDVGLVERMLPAVNITLWGRPGAS